MFSNEIVKRGLSAHSVIGLTVGALLYIICLTGTLAVLEHEIERWQQPTIPEFETLNAKAIAHSSNQFLRKTQSQAESLYVVLPTKELPRAHISDVETEYYLSEQGDLIAPPVEGFLHLLVDLHVHLHMGETVGIIFVSCLGAMLLALIVSGILAHPKIFKEAFRLKLGGQKRLEQVDIHNRLSVWGLPFHIMMGITGAFFGLVGIMATIAANFYYQGDTQALMDDVYGADPVITAPPTSIISEDSVEKALSYFSELNGDNEQKIKPIYFVFQKLGAENHFFEVAATHPGRLIYSEIYRFYPNGDFMNYQQLSDGSTARQIAYSVYRLHFGQFDNPLVKIIYIVLGLSLTIVCVTGINIWMARTQQGERLKSAWAGIVWGTPLSLCMCAILFLIIEVNSIIDFLLVLAVNVVIAMALNHEERSQRTLKTLLSASLICLTLIHSIIFKEVAFSGIFALINSSLLITALIILFNIHRKQNSSLINNTLATNNK